jgi:hypothetical protein
MNALRVSPRSTVASTVEGSPARRGEQDAEEGPRRIVFEHDAPGPASN